MTTQPFSYDLADHLARLLKSDDFARLAHAHGHEHAIEKFTAELKAAVKANAEANLAAFEKTIGGRALANLAKKFEADKAA